MIQLDLFGGTVEAVAVEAVAVEAVAVAARKSWWGSAAPGPWCDECDCDQAARCPKPSGGRWECACGYEQCTVRPHWESERQFLTPVYGQKGWWSKWPLGEIWIGKTAAEASPQGDWRFIP